MFSWTIPPICQGGQGMEEAANDPHRFDFDLDLGIRQQVVDALENSSAPTA